MPVQACHAVHFIDMSRPELTARYLLVVDSLNFCFWQDEEFEYENLAGGIKASVLRDSSCLDAARLAEMTSEGLQALVGWKRALPLQEERARLLREVGQGLLQGYEGQASNLIHAAGRSAARLVELVTAAFPGFRDHTIYRGRQVFFYKRAQIFVGDVWGAFQGQGLGCFPDIHCLTMFADYRVPVVLRELGVLQYSEQLASKVDSRQELQPGSTEEVEIRAATVVAVDALRAAVATKFGQHQLHSTPAREGDAVGAGTEAGDPNQALVEERLPNSVQLDWWLWEQGERARQQHRPHHRTLTIYY
ncbi:hypothetical protein N2152v2_007415 [Parachlorella kessleri]